MKNFIYFSVIFGLFILLQGKNLRLCQAISSNDWLNDIDGDNIPGQAELDYPVYATVPEGTSFRCSDYDYAGYFGDVEAGCQAYHVCFPDGRNASFLCVNGTVFHQRYFVCDWWFHFNCSHGPNLYELNLYRKIPLPVLPPVQRRPFTRPTSPPKVDLLTGPIPQPRSNFISENPRTQQRTPKKLELDNPAKAKNQGKEKKANKEAVPPTNGRRTFMTNNLQFDNGTKMRDQCYCECNDDRRDFPPLMFL